MTYGIDISGTEIRWVRFSAESNMATCGRIPLDERSSNYTLKQTVKRLFAAKKVRSFVYPIWGVGVRAKLFGSNKVD
ncbi:hypothetical protein GF359_07350, partial [candidate division WOR-3 bacterium]|nr:hypothetical protein [candidate division WOR-3 bacterium]MBD3365015.1 hypothetical protein [candidate division WOR-3 bacterium]